MINDDSDAGVPRHNPDGGSADTPQPVPLDTSVSQPDSPSVDVSSKVVRLPWRRQTRRRGKSKDSEKRTYMLAVDDEPVLLTRAQAANLAQISLSKLDQWSREPDCPVIREGRHFVRFPREAFITWIESRHANG